MTKNQLCPICKNKVTKSGRYPDYLCTACVNAVTDKNGKPLQFYNTHGLGHGCAGSYKDGDDKTRNLDVGANRVSVSHA